MRPNSSRDLNKLIMIEGLAVNIRKVFKKMGRELAPYNKANSNMIDLVNHADSLAQQIESEVYS